MDLQKFIKKQYARGAKILDERNKSEDKASDKDRKIKHLNKTIRELKGDIKTMEGRIATMKKAPKKTKAVAISEEVIELEDEGEIMPQKKGSASTKPSSEEALLIEEKRREMKYKWDMMNDERIEKREERKQERIHKSKQSRAASTQPLSVMGMSVSGLLNGQAADIATIVVSCCFILIRSY